MIDVVEEGVERLHPLLDAEGEPVPFGFRHDARNEIEGDEALGCLFLAVDIEGDAGAPEEAFGLGRLRGEILGILRGEPLEKLFVGLPDVGFRQEHLVEWRHGSLLTVSFVASL